MTGFFTRFSFFFVLLFSGLNAEAQSVGGIASGTTFYCSSANSGFVSVTGYTGTILNWVSSIDGGVTWNNIGNPTPSQSYFNLTQTTCYRAIVKNGAFPNDTSTAACITVYSPSVGGTIPGGGTFCAGSGSGMLTLTGNNGNVLNWQNSTNAGGSWTSISNTTTTLNHGNITQNTMYRAIVQNGASCPTDTSTQVSFIIHPMTVAGTISSSDTVCYATNAGTLTLTGNVGTVLSWAYSANNISWLPIGNTTTSQSYSGLIQTTWYTAVVKSGICAADTAYSVNIKVWPRNLVNAGNDTSIVQGQSLILNGSGSGTPLWIPSTGLNNATIFNPAVTPVNSINYILVVTDVNSCINSDTVLITVIVDEFKGMVANLLTPNGDGINDNWFIQDIQYYPNQVFVYNLYGNEVYSQKNYANDWQGTYNGAALPDGTYYYVIKFDESDQIIKGSVDIIKSK